MVVGEGGGWVTVGLSGAWRQRAHRCEEVERELLRVIDARVERVASWAR